MASKARRGPLFLALNAALCLLVLCVQRVGAQNGCMSGIEQPVVNSIDPPSGTTGTDSTLSTTYTITGQRLDRVATVNVLTQFSTSAMIIQQEPTRITFHLLGSLSRTGGTIASLVLQPNNTNCSSVTLEVSLHDTIVTSFSVRVMAQPGTIIVAGRGTCLPNVCGDNSSSYDIIVGGIVLDKLRASEDGFVARFPDFVAGQETAITVIATQYQTFTLPISNHFTLNNQTDNAIISPTQGQKGTRITITGESLLGIGDGMLSPVVKVGGNIAELVSSTQERIELRASGGTPGPASIQINTTQSFTGEGEFDGPYTFLEDVWVQLEEGFVSDIIPPAVQTGGTVTLCGDNLLGGGTSVDSVTLAGELVTVFPQIPTPSNGSLPAIECISVQVPAHTEQKATGRVTVLANTGATVDSIGNFTFAEVQTVTPSRGQPDTIVTITGVALLSGYDSAAPTVNVSGIEATLISASNTRIVVRVTEPPQGISNVFGQPGIVVITVTDSLLSFSVTSSSPVWTYEVPGEINNVDPNFGQFGTQISVTGTNLLGYGTSLTHAMVGESNATLIEETDTRVVLSTPHSDVVGPVNIVLFSGNGARIVGQQVFEYRERGRITNSTPNRGQRGTFVILTGSNLFGHGSNVTDVLFGGISADIDHSRSNSTSVYTRVGLNEDIVVDTAVMITITADTLAIVQSVGDIWTYIVQGVINSIAPPTGQEGTLVTITGTNLLGGGSSVISVFVDGVIGTLVSGTDTSVVVSMGAIESQQTNFFPGQGYILSDSGAIVFGGRYIQRTSGIIASFTPLTGRRGTLITVIGVNLLGFGTMISQVTVAGNVGRVVSSNNTRVTVEAQTGPEASQGPIQLTINTGAVISSTLNFTYEPPGIVTDVTPQQGAEGSGVLIRGSALWPANTQLIRVTFSGIPVSRIVTATTSEISVIVGPRPSTNPAEIVITASDGSFVDGVFFTFLDLVITLPDVSSGREGTLLEISLPTLSQFDRDGVLLATIDGIEAEIVNSDIVTVTVGVPRARRQGVFLVDVAVEDSQHLVARLQNGFTYLPEGAICKVTPSSGQMETVVLLEGYNFLGGGTTIESVVIAGIPANIQSSNETNVRVDISENPPLSSVFPLAGDILLTADTGATTSRLDSFALVKPGQILTVSPSTGQEGTRVIISGTDLLQGTLNVLEVYLDGEQANVVNAMDTEITVEAAQSPASSQPGQVTITLSSRALTTSGSGVTFEYLEPGEIVTAVPNVGTLGTRITITGSNLLGGGTTLDHVSLGGVNAVIESFSETMVKVTAQAGTPVSLADVEIVSDTGARIVKQSFWSYEAIGVINNIEPPVGQQGLEVIIQGESLLGQAVSGAVECRLAGIVGQVRSFTTDKVICAAGFFPDLASHPNNGSGPAQITTDTGVVITSNPNVTSFTYYQAVISQVQPSAGNNGTVVSIAGINLFGFPGEGSTVESVQFGGIAADVLMSSVNDITVRVGPSPIATGNSSVRVTSSVGSFLELSGAWSYSPPVQIVTLMPNTTFSGATVVLMGVNLAPPGVSSVVVVVGQTVSSEAQIINSTVIEFQTGVYQSTDNAEEPLPVQLVYNTGQIVFDPSVTFTYIPTPSVITSVQPNAGNSGARVSITGSNLLNNQNLTAVVLAGVPVLSVEGNATEEEIIVIAGPGSANGDFGTVVIETSDGRQSGLAGNAWRYYPIVDNVSPQAGQNGTSISIDLSGVTPLPAINNVILVGLSVPLTSVDSNQQLIVSAVQSNATASPVGDIVIGFNDSSELVIENVWRYLPPVIVTDVIPNMQGYFNTTLTLLGQNFLAGGVFVSTVYVAGVQTTIESQTVTQLQVRITEPRDSGTAPFSGPVVIMSSEGATYTSPFNFSYVQVRVDSVVPSEGQRGTIVSITGAGLKLGGNTVNSFLLGNVEAMVLNVSDSVISVSASTFPTQTNISSITYVMDTGAEVTIPNSWRYIVPGEISSVSPEEGSMGTVVTIMGTNLFGGGDRAETVLLNDVPAQSVISNFNSFIQVIAGQSVSALSPGNVQIISNTGAVTEATSAVDFSYLTPGMVSTALPLVGQNGTRVEIGGSFLHNGEGIRKVLIAGVESTIEDINQDLLTAGFPTTIIVSAGRPLNLESFSGPITVVSNFNSMSVSELDFMYLSEGVIFTVTPPQGRNGTLVVIAGENLLGGGTSLESVYLAGIQADIIGTPTSGRVEVMARSNVNGFKLFGDVILTSDTQAFVARVDGWCYVQDGTVTNIQPSVGQVGTNVVITGERLLSGGEGIVNIFLDSVVLEVLSSMNERVEATVTLPATPVDFNTSSITLISNYGGVLMLAFQWKFLNQSDITNVSPSSGPGNTEVIITGTDLLGGGTTIMSAVVEDIDAVVTSSNDSVVMIVTGFNTNGQQRIGDIVLQSDTGARTLEINAWTYINECPTGFYGNTGNCLPCDEECQSCFGPNATDCYTCNNFAISLQDSSTASSDMLCVSSCLNVSTINKVCRDSCELSEYAIANTTENATFCQPCHPQCDPNRSCSGPTSTQCGGCRNFIDSINQTCIEECPQGTFVDEQRRCIPCDSQCVSEEGCFGSTSAQCNNCSNVYVTATLMDGRRSDFCMERCPSLYYQQPAGSRLCSPCDEKCVAGCTGPSPFNCNQCANASFVFPNGTTKCVTSCNTDPAGEVTYYEDTAQVCQPCSSRCSLTGGCFGPTAFDCYGCRRLAGGSGSAIPSLNGECLNSCPNINSTYSFYADNSTNQCEACDRACEIGCLGPQPQDCFLLSSNYAGIVILTLLFITFFVLALALAVFIVYQRRKGDIYKVGRDSNNAVELGNRYSSTNIKETKLTLTGEKDNEMNTGVANAAFTDGGDLYSEATDAEESIPPKIDIPIVFADELHNDMKKSEGETVSQDLLYTAMHSTVNGVEYAVPSPKALRKKEVSTSSIKPPPRPSKPGEVNGSKPPPPRPPSPEMDGEVYTDMETGIQEVHINKGADENLSEMSLAPLIDDVYDDVTVPANVSSQTPNAKTPEHSKEDEMTPLLDLGGMYEDTDTAVAMATDYIRKTSTDQGDSAYKRISRLQEIPPELPFRPPVRKRTSVPLPETPLQKSLSGSSFTPISSTHQPIPTTGEDVYIEPIPIEESLYEAIPGTAAAMGQLPPAESSPPSQANEIPLPPKPKK